MARTGLAAACVVLTLATAGRASGRDLRLPLDGIPVVCVDDATGWYVAVVVRGWDDRHFRLKVAKRIHGPARVWIPLEHELSVARYSYLHGIRAGLRVVVRTPTQMAPSMVGAMGGCPSLFFEGSHGSDEKAYPLRLGPRTAKRSRQGDAFHHRLAYLRTHFALLARPTVAGLVTALRSTSLPVRMAAVDIAERIFSKAVTDPAVWDAIGPEAVVALRRTPDFVSYTRRLVVADVVRESLRYSSRLVRAAGGARRPWWDDAARALVALASWRLVHGASDFSDLAVLSEAGYPVPAERIRAADVVKLRSKLGMPALKIPGGLTPQPRVPPP